VGHTFHSILDNEKSLLNGQKFSTKKTVKINKKAPFIKNW